MFHEHPQGAGAFRSNIRATRGMTERCDSAAIIPGTAEDPAPRSSVTPQALATQVGALADTAFSGHRRLSHKSRPELRRRDRRRG